MICEGSARLLEKPYPEPLPAVFSQDYEWNVTTDEQYDTVVEITPEKWLAW